MNEIGINHACEGIFYGRCFKCRAQGRTAVTIALAIKDCLYKEDKKDVF